MTDPRNPLSANRPLFLGFLTLFLLVFGLGGWSLLTTLSGAVIAPGRIEVEQNRQVVQHPDGGVVEAIAVQEGQTVRAGDVLIQLDGTLLKSELAIVENQLYELFARRGRLEAERDDGTEVTFPQELTQAVLDHPDAAEIVQGQTRLFAARRETLLQQVGQLTKRVGQIVSQIEGIDAQIAAQSNQIALLSTELEGQQALYSKGLAKVDRVLALQREEARIEGELGELKASRAQADGRITEIELQKLGLGSQRREDAISELRDVAYRELELAERRRALAERVARLEIRAPVSGIVFGLSITTPRSVIRAAEPVLYLIPQDRPLVITAQISPVHVDEVHVGQEVRVRFSAFASRTTPELRGRVEVVSADALRDEATQASFYRAEILLEPGEIEKLDGQTLMPGMPVEAFFRTADRTPMSYLVKPFTDYFTRAFRET